MLDDLGATYWTCPLSELLKCGQQGRFWRQILANVCKDTLFGNGFAPHVLTPNGCTGPPSLSAPSAAASLAIFPQISDWIRFQKGQRMKKNSVIPHKNMGLFNGLHNAEKNYSTDPI